MTNPAGRRLILISQQMGGHDRSSNRINFFAERVDKPTDQKTSQCFATANDAKC
jgi:hypothetical protein